MHLNGLAVHLLAVHLPHCLEEDADDKEDEDDEDDELDDDEEDYAYGADEDEDAGALGANFCTRRRLCVCVGKRGFGWRIRMCGP